MDMSEFQRRASGTDQNPSQSAVLSEPRIPNREHVIPLLGLAGEVGSLLAEYKKLLRDGTTHRRFQDEVAEELGDVLWYVANLASKFGLNLEDIAAQNLAKVHDRWLPPGAHRPLYDESLAPNQQLPRQFTYSFEDRNIEGIVKTVLVDRTTGHSTGDPLTNNAYEDDGYRFHDVLHLALMAHFGWSPVIRKLLRKANRLQHRTPQSVDEVEDGGRAQLIDEAIVAAAYVYAADHNFLDGVDAIDWQLLRHIKQLTAGLEVRNRSTWEWNRAILRGFEVWRQLRAHGAGTVRGDLMTCDIEFVPPAS